MVYILKLLQAAKKEEALLTLSLKWLDKNKKKTDLQKAFQTWFSKCEPKIDCTLQELLPDEQAVIVVSPPPGTVQLCFHIQTCQLPVNLTP